MAEENNVSRRRFVSTAAAGLFAGSVAASTAAADPEGDSEYPVYAQGTRKHHFEPLGGERFEHRERFVSQDLQDAFGKATITLETEEIHRDEVPDKFKGPDRAGKISGADDGVFGTWEQHANAERDLREGVSTESHDYTGPLYNYKDGDVSERSAPINVGWRSYHGFDAGEVNDIMWDNGWDGTLISTDRYVMVLTGSYSYDIRKQAYHTKKPTGWTTQWHGRLWNIPDADDDGYDVIGSYHHDPWDHGWLGGDDWRFSDSRQKASDDWESWGYYANTQDVGNGSDYDTSDGKFDYI